MASVYRANGNGKSTTVMTTALLYTRVSSDEQAKEGLSLDSQLADCRRYAATNGWSLGTEYQDILSGKRDDRPAYQAMLTDIRRYRAEGRPIVVVVKWLHRLGRRVLERVRCREELKALGVPLHSIAEGGEVSDLVANILASVAEEEVRQLGERVQAVNRHLASTGWARPGQATWGYCWRKPTDDERANGSPKAVLDVDPTTAPFVQEAYAKAASGMPGRSVFRWVSLLPSAARGGKVLTHRSIQMVLSSPTYIACTRVDGELLPGRWPALIDRATWERVAQANADHEHMPHQASRRYLLTGLLRCPRCGARMRGSLAGRLVYRCGGINCAVRASIEVNCAYSVGLPILDVSVLEQVGAVVESLTSQDAAFQQALRSAWRQLQQPDVAGTVVGKVQQLERERDRAQDRLRNAALLFVDGKIDRYGYELARDAAQSDLASATAELERGSEVAPAISLPPLDDVLRDLGGWSRLLRDGDAGAKRDVLSLLIDRVTPIRVGWGQYDVQIAWSPLGEGLHRLSGAIGGIHS